MKWFRLYTEVLDDEKVQTLPLESRWGWVMLLCLAAENPERGLVPPLKRVAFKLRISEAKAAKLLRQLTDAGLLDQTANGLTPHNWDERQYASDDVTERVRKHREKRNVTRVKRFTDVTPNVSLSARDRLQITDSEVVVVDAGVRELDNDRPTEDAPPIESTPKGFPVRSEGHRRAIDAARDLFGDQLAEAVADQGQAIEYAIWQGDGPRWDCYVAAVENAKRSTKPIANVLTWALAAAKRYAVDGIPPPPVAFTGTPPPARASPATRPPSRILTDDEFRARIPMK